MSARAAPRSESSLCIPVRGGVGRRQAREVYSVPRQGTFGIACEAAGSENHGTAEDSRFAGAGCAVHNPRNPVVRDEDLDDVAARPEIKVGRGL